MAVLAAVAGIIGGHLDWLAGLPNLGCKFPGNG